jgi:hypothetical protein
MAKCHEDQRWNDPFLGCKVRPRAANGISAALSAATHRPLSVQCDGKLNHLAPVRRVRDLEKGSHQLQAVNDDRIIHCRYSFFLMASST